MGSSVAEALDGVERGALGAWGRFARCARAVRALCTKFVQDHAQPA